MRRISFLKKLRLFLFYRKTVLKLKTKVQDLDARIDRALRIYTVVNIPPGLIEEPYNLKKADIDNLAKTYIKEYTNKMSDFLNGNGLIELYDIYDVKKVDKYSYLLIFGFSLLNTAKLFRNMIIFSMILTLLSTIIITLLLL